MVGAGVTLLEALKAADLLKAEGINLRVIDPFTIKPLDADLIASSVKHTDGRLITVEDHAPEGEVQSIVFGDKIPLWSEITDQLFMVTQAVCQRRWH